MAAGGLFGNRSYRPSGAHSEPGCRAHRGNHDVGNTAGQGRPASANDYGSWRLFLINKTMGAIRQLSPALAGEAQSLGNPTVSFVTLPPPTPGVAGAPALVFTCFVFGANNGTPPPGGHIFVYPLP